MVPVREFLFICVVFGCDVGIAHSRAGYFEPVDGQERVCVLDEFSYWDFDWSVAEAVVCEDFVGEFVVSLRGMGWSFLLLFVLLRCCCGLLEFCRIVLVGRLLKSSPCET